MECRGSVILGYYKYIKKTWGNIGEEECTKAIGLNPDQVKESIWYDIKYSEMILEWIYKNKGEEAVVNCGTYTVKDLGFLSYIVRFANVKKIIGRAPESHSDAFKGNGSLKVDIKDNGALITMRNTAVSEYSCMAWRGCFIGVLDMTNTTGTVIEKQCQLKDADHCEFVMEWS